VDEGHAAAFQDIEGRCERGGRHHGEDGHAVHVVRNGLAIGDAEAVPASALGGLQTLQEVEEGNGAFSVLCIARGDIGKD